ncbi:unnamed protein product [Caenorhabditis bovis]|uniref:Copine C-terminal domain-containing protein n=1 Tax=Caenorhabditis bovis TaxID=2654633 RepID=A0A8S1EX18_9PELO|nr:unnamed protein product [Caenorhabditis bovis]
MEMRRACKMPPLLPPKLRKETCDSDKKGVKDVLDISMRIQIVAPEKLSSKFYYLQLFESQDNSDGPWNLITESEQLDSYETYELEEIFAIEYCFERLQWIRIDVLEKTDVGNTVNCSAVFNVAHAAINNYDLTLRDHMGSSIAEIEIWSQIRERPQPILIQVEAKNISSKLISSNSNIAIEVYKYEELSRKKLLYRSEGLRQPKLTWRSFNIQSDDLYGDEKSIEIVCISDDEKEGIVGHAVITQDNAKANEPIPIYSENFKQGRKPIGEFRVVKFSQLRAFSFLEYIRTGTTLRFAFAIDFSAREHLMTRDDHFQFANDVEFVVRSIGETVEPFNASNSFLSYGFGAKIPPQSRESNNFCLSLDVDPTTQGVNGVLNAFMKCYQRVLPLSTAKFSQIIYHMAKTAQTNYNKDASCSYFVLFIITRGAVDDLKETVQAAIYSSKVPISIVFIGVGVDGLDEVDRIGSAGKRLEYQGRKSERDNLQYVNATKTRLECDNYSEMVSTFLYKTLQNITWQLPAFFMQNHVTPGRSVEGRRPSASLSRDSSNTDPLDSPPSEEHLERHRTISGDVSSR